MAFDIQGRRCRGLHVLAPSRVTLGDDQHTEEVKGPMTPAGLYTSSAIAGSCASFTHHHGGPDLDTVGQAL